MVSYIKKVKFTTTPHLFDFYPYRLRLVFGHSTLSHLGRSARTSHDTPVGQGLARSNPHKSSTKRLKKGKKYSALIEPIRPLRRRRLALCRPLVPLR